MQEMSTKPVKEEVKKEKKDPEVIVKVTKAHIKKGIKNDTLNNPIALAVNDKMTKLKIKKCFVSIGSDVMIVYRKKGKVMFVDEEVDLSEEIINWNEAYNSGKEVKPFEFNALKLQVHKLFRPCPQFGRKKHE